MRLLRFQETPQKSTPKVILLLLFLFSKHVTENKSLQTPFFPIPLLVCLLQPVCSYCDCTCIEMRILDYSWCNQEYYSVLSLETMWLALIVLLVSIFPFLFILAAWHSMGTSSMWQNTWSTVAYTASTSVLGQLPASSSYATLQYNYSGLNCDT